MTRNKIEIKAGDRFQMLTVVTELERRKGRRFARFQCDCGSVKDMMLTNVARGTTKSCGCLNSKIVIERNQKHGLCNDPAYWVHAGMLQRCKNKKTRNAPRYADRGIMVCDEWLDVKAFIEWAHLNGYKKGLQIDRIDNDRGYSPGNCRFVNAAVNAQNRSTSFIWSIRGIEFPSCAAAGKHFSVNAQTICNWVGRKEPDCSKRPLYA